MHYYYKVSNIFLEILIFFWSSRFCIAFCDYSNKWVQIEIMEEGNRTSSSYHRGTKLQLRHEGTTMPRQQLNPLKMSAILI